MSDKPRVTPMSDEEKREFKEKLRTIRLQGQGMSVPHGKS